MHFFLFLNHVSSIYEIISSEVISESISFISWRNYRKKLFVPGGAFFGAVGGGNTCLIYFAVAFLVRSIFLRNFWSRVKITILVRFQMIQTSIFGADSLIWLVFEDVWLIQFQRPIRLKNPHQKCSQNHLKTHQNCNFDTWSEISEKNRAHQKCSITINLVAIMRVMT